MIEAAGGSASFIHADVLKAVQVERAFNDIKADDGQFLSLRDPSRTGPWF
tara:strand:- start:1391 stop:1540 length:150 start_codon:yes stop_codon:yes gene_type:complete